MLRALVVVLLSLTVVLSTVVSSGFGMHEKDEDRDQLWKAVQNARDARLPKTAIEKLNQIHELAVADKDWPEATYARCLQFQIEGQINQPVQQYVIRQLQKAIPAAPEQMQPMMKVMLAEYYFNFYMSNVWRFNQRSQTAAKASDDFETWDLTRILDEVDRNFQDALADSETLKQIPVGQYKKLTQAGDISDAHRPTLFDFLAFEAIGFYSRDEQFLRQQGAFEIKSDGPVFASTEEFLAWEPVTDDVDSFTLRTVKTLQDLLRFHQSDDDKTALLDAELHRLAFARQLAAGSEDETIARYRAALTRFIDDNRDHPLCSLAYARLAASYKAKDEWVKAHELASQGKRLFEDSRGGRECHNLIQQLTAKDFSINTERNFSGKVVIDVDYRNVDRLWFRLVPFDFENWGQWGRRRTPQNLPPHETETLIKKAPAASWSVDLPATADFKRRTEAVPADVDVPSGCYVLIASSREDFAKSRDGYAKIALAEVWVSQLAVVVRSGLESGAGVQVFDAQSGNPIAGAEVLTAQWKRNGRSSSETNRARTTTDENGMAFFKATGNSCKILVKSGDQKLGIVENPRGNSRQKSRATSRTIFFTDRAIYRPGQQIQFKGICQRTNPDAGQYATLANKSVDVVLHDANGQQVERRTFRSNEFGSFAGSFTAPRNRVTGGMQIKALGVPGSTTVRVEEYKRPKFFATLEKPKDAFALGQKVTVNGKATAYTGSAIDSGNVDWRVVRTVRYPAWCYSRYWGVPFGSEQQEIANGKTTTDANGSFDIEFVAQADNSIDRKYQPVFRFVVYASVTDGAGETRSTEQSTSIGYTSLEARLDVKDWQTAGTDVAFDVAVETLDGEGQQAMGKLKIYRLKSPEKVHRKGVNSARGRSNGGKVAKDLSDIRSWELGEVAIEKDVATVGEGSAKIAVGLAAGAYKAVFETSDPGGNAIVAESTLVVHDPAAEKFNVKVPSFFQVQSQSVEVGENLNAVFATGYESGRAWVEIEHRGKIVKSFWTKPDSTIEKISFPIEEKHRGGLQLKVTFVHENRVYLQAQRIDVPWSNKKLQVKWEHFVSNLQPGGKETWTAVIKGPDAQNAAAEMVATLYDASLDAFVAHRWQEQFGFYRDNSRVSLRSFNRLQYFQVVHNHQDSDYRSGGGQYRHFNHQLGLHSLQGSMGIMSRGGFQTMSFGARTRMTGMRTAQLADARGMDFENAEGMIMDSAVADGARMRKGRIGGGLASDEPPAVDSGVNLEQVSPRKNLQETAFFFPQLQVDADGIVRMEFEIPEALTKWNFNGFAHDSELRSCLLSDEMTTSKDLMVQPNPPRFLREGDLLEFSVKVTNQSDEAQSGTCRLALADARTGDSVDESFGNVELDRSFDVPARQSRTLFWKLNVPDYVGVLTYKAIGGNAAVSDGEEGFLPVLSRRILVKESLPLPIRGNQTKTFEFKSLLNAASSDSLQTQSLTVQVASNPSWYAVLSLPYLMEYPHQCSEQVFNRLYANSLGQHIVASDPRIDAVFKQWRATDALDSPLEKNEDLLNVMIAETPWLLDAKKESQARRDVGILFDRNRMKAETNRALEQLSGMQLGDGAWPWFPGGRASDYITLYVVTGFGRLRHLGVEVNVRPAQRAIDRIDWWLDQQYKRIVRDERLDENNLTSTVCLYLYGRSFFLKDKPVADSYQAAFNYFVSQAKQNWAKVDHRQSHGHVALALHRMGDRVTPPQILESLTERSVQEDELGMYWRETERSWWWYRAPIETQALMIEAYEEIARDPGKVEELKIWLLKQKQTQNWKSTKATADACYGLLLRGTSQLASTKLVDVKLGGDVIKPEDVEPGTGFYEQKFIRGEVKPEMGKIEMSKSDDGIAWGSVHWSYLEDVGKIKPYQGTPLTLNKGLFIKKNTKKGPVIEPVTGPVSVGDELVMRVEVRVDRAMEFVHLKDYRGSGTEPVNVLSQYKYQDGLAYYESTRDTASHFFIDYLPRGTYVFEYSVRVQHRGKYQTGIAELQCMYAPEFNSHSASVEILVE